MAARAAVLSFAFAAAFAVLLAGARAEAAVAAQAPSCEACHPVHNAALGGCTGCHRGDPASNRKALAHHALLRGAAAAWSTPGSRAVEEGAQLRETLGCRRCHVTGGNGNRLAIALDAVVWRRDQDALRRSLRTPVTTMPDFALTEAQADRLIAVLLRDGDRQGAEDRYVVRFRQGGPRGPHPFERLCGPCHRALTALGPMGTGRTGPDLSGLLTEFYPSTDGRHWDRERLRRWLRNPRAERPNAIMPPLEITEPELGPIFEVLTPVDSARFMQHRAPRL